MFLSQAIGSAMAARGFGRIINIADTSATRPWVHRAPHSVSKTGLVMLTRLLSQAYAPHVLTNAISPGSVLVPDGAGPEVEQNLAAETFVGHIGTPGDVVDAMLYLVSAEFVTGQVLVVDGGQSEHT
jgi:NAD(P)-dependent dehydrogenase (short-subunit alcohol dehydrogenase family)